MDGAHANSVNQRSPSAVLSRWHDFTANYAGRHMHPPFQRQRVAESPAKQAEFIPAAVEEFVRLYTPYRGFTRTTSKDVELHGRLIRPGEPITMTYASVNRDPSVFPYPEKFILNRKNVTAHLGFGKGCHRCVSMPLARL
jgi:cytochrome P450